MLKTVQSSIADIEIKYMNSELTATLNKMKIKQFENQEQLKGFDQFREEEKMDYLQGNIDHIGASLMEYILIISFKSAVAL
jgi:hypothetical protein